MLTTRSQFQEVKVISLPERDDKRDAWAVTTSVSGFTVDLMDGVHGASISPNALPYPKTSKPGVLGCWRAHMNMLRDLVERQVSSALIFEDDADWDVALKAQLFQLGRGSRWVLNQSETATLHSPYGDGWDVLWIGTCEANINQQNVRRFVIDNDLTAGDSSKFYAHNEPVRHSPSLRFQTRVVFSMWDGYCTTAYAVSLSGAKKILYHLGLQPVDAPIDLGMSSMCEEKKSGFSCIAPYPPLIGTYRPAGRRSGWSDIEDMGGSAGDEIEEFAHAERLQFSTRMNLERLLRGEKSFVTDGGEGHEERDLSDIAAAVGQGESVDRY